MRLSNATLALGAVVGMAACATGGNESIPPTQPAAISLPSQAALSQTNKGHNDGTLAPNASLTRVVGKVTNAWSGGITVATVIGQLHVYANSSTKYTDGSPRVGEYVAAIGKGSPTTYVDSTEISILQTASGTVSHFFSGGFTIKTSAGYLHVFTNSSTVVNGSKPSVGASVLAAGTGSPTTKIYAYYLQAAPKVVSATAMTHVLTADKFGPAVSPSRAAPYLTWAEAGASAANAIHDAGIKTMFYVEATRTVANVGDPLFTSTSSTFSENCSGGRVTDTYQSDIVQYVMAPGSSALRTLFRSYLESILAQGHFDAILEDDMATLNETNPYSPLSSFPCDYSDSGWISAENGLDAYSPVPVIFNGLSGLQGENVSLTLGLLSNSNTIGGTFEECYSSDSLAKMDGWLWQAIENTEIDVAATGKLFQCMVTNQAAASSQTNARLYAYASFLLTYSPTTSMYFTEFATPSTLHVMPETQFVPLDPATVPSNIGSLHQSGGTYAQTFRSCYFKGALVGACAVVVNPSGSQTYHNPFGTYHHSLSLSGSGVLDGGTVSTTAAAPASLGPEQAAILLP
jgi:hypothetical protein